MLNLKKMVSALLGVTMVANMALSMPTFADETTGCTYAYDGYEVSYDVTNSWGNTEVVSLTLTNTGSETIEDWMLYFTPIRFCIYDAGDSIYDSIALIDEVKVA